MLRSFLRSLRYGPAAVQLRRFVTVGAFTAGVQMALLWLFVDSVGLDYLLGAAISIEITIILTYVLNNAWTFEATQHTSTVAYLTGLLKTNVVRGSAIPIQLGVLYALVVWLAVPYLAANAVGIVVSGGYRFTFDSYWTWG